MSLKAFTTNVGDMFEALGKWAGLGDETSKQVGDNAAYVLSEVIKKWSTDGKLFLLAEAKDFYTSYKNGMDINDLAGQLVDHMKTKGVDILTNDALDAIGMHRMVSPSEG